MKNFKKNLQKVLQELGLIDKVKAQTLSDEDWVSIAQAYKDQTGNDFYADSMMTAEDRQRIEAHDNALQLLGDDDSTEDESGEDNAEGETKPVAKVNLPGKIKELQTTVQTLQAENKALAKQTEEDALKPTNMSIIGIGGAHSATHAFGVEHPMFAVTMRCNKVAIHRGLPSEPDDDDAASFQLEVKKFGKEVCARIKTLHEMGAYNQEAIQKIDYSNLTNAGLGEQYVVRRIDALIVRIISLPSVFGIFPLRSYIQDKELITNAFFEEFSQAYQEGEISKGGAELVPEMARVDDAMFKHLFKSMKWIERQYIGYLNTNGSDPTKWGMIEWMILNIATALNNERNVRSIRGCRVEPETGKNGSFLNVSTGIIYRLLSYVEDYKIHPFYDDFSSYNATNMVDVVENFVEETHLVLETLLGKSIYLNDKHKPWYKQSFRKKYGEQTDFSDGVKVMNYDINIVWVPNMGKLQLIFIQDVGNLQCLENIPGEMFNVRFEQRLESVWGYSVWKEGTGVAYAGKPFDSIAAMKADERQNQVIFMNYPATALAPDATTLSAKDNFLFVTGVNTKETVLTDITDTIKGVVCKIEIGDVTFPTKIAKTGKFENLKSAWTPTTVGQWIKVLYDKESSKFKEVDRSK